jgi:hypothetical protein
MGRVPVNDEILQAARELLSKRPGADQTKLRQIIDGKVKSVDVDWWREQNGVERRRQVERLQEKYNAKLDSIKAMADPARNPNGPQRRIAEAALAKLKAEGPPKLRMRSAPGLEEYDREAARLTSRAQGPIGCRAQSRQGTP